MKKVISLSLFLLLGACSGASFMQKANDMKACLTEQAQARILDGSALAAPVKTTVQEMLNACLTAEEQTPANYEIAKSILTGLIKKQSEK